MDKKRLIGEEVPQITQGDIDAWNRGKDDAAKNKLLRASQKISPRSAIKLVKMYAELGDIHYLATRFDVSADEARKVLNAFGINSIEDAKASVRKGLIAEYDDAVRENQEVARQDQAAEHAAAQARLDKQDKIKQPVTEEKTLQEQDLAFAQRREEAQRRNKEDQLRQLIAEGIDPDTGKSSFRIPLKKIIEFQQMVPHGVSQLQRRFGGSNTDILNEIKRLAPNIDISMLRP